MKEIKVFENEMCKNCKNNKKENLEKCEIFVSRIDGHLYCPNFTENVEKHK